MCCSPADFKQKSTDTKATGETGAHVLQMKHLVAITLHPHRLEELLNSHCRGHNCRCRQEIWCSSLKAYKNTVN